MIRKQILLIALVLFMSGCSGIAKIKERYHRAPFESSIDKGTYDIKLYSINYPSGYMEKVEFYNNFDRLMIKLLAYDSTLNILYPEELKADMIELEKDNLLEEEEIFAKPASELSNDDKKKIDALVSVNRLKDKSESQYYLSKQIAFLLKTLKATTIEKIEDQVVDLETSDPEENLSKSIVEAAHEKKAMEKAKEEAEKELASKESEKYQIDDGNLKIPEETQAQKEKDKLVQEKIEKTNKVIENYSPIQEYSESDKEKILIELKERRKSLLKLAGEVEMNTLLNVKSPYESNEKIDQSNTYWDKKEVYIDRDTKINPEILKNNSYMYIKGVETQDIKKVEGRQLQFSSKIVVLENELYNGYTVLNGKYIFFTGGKYNLNYYDGYEINLSVKDVKLEDLLTIDDDILLTDFLNPKPYVERQEK